MQHITLDINGYTFDAYEDGPSNGPFVLLLHGFPQSAWSYRHQIPVLAAAGYHVVAPDQRGYSPGARPREVEKYASSCMIDDALKIADHFGAEQFHLVGHDWGAGIAWGLASLFPDRLLSLTALSVPHPFALGRALAGEKPADGSANDQADRSSYFALFTSPEAEDAFLNNDAEMLKMLFVMTGLTPEDAQPYVDRMSERAALTGALNWYRASFGVLSDAASQAAMMTPVTMPTLYVWSTEDPALGRLSADLCGEYVTGPYTYVVLDGVNHWIAEQVPDKLNELLITHLRSSLG